MAEIDLAHYSRALDEIYRLRAALAYEARVTESHLGLKTFPKSRRAAAEHQVERMREAARGGGAMAYFRVNPEVMKRLLRDAGASETLTRGQWEEKAPVWPQDRAIDITFVDNAT